MTQTYTPMMLQYLDIKKQHQEEILFYRLGDFYEMFFDDAKLASKELDITLTGRDAGTSERVPMCGVPYHAAENYIGKLITKGYKVAICEQVEDARATKGIVRREVIRIITPGTILADNMLEQKNNNFISLLFEQGNKVIVATADISTGEFNWLKCDNLGQVEDYFSKIIPSEVILASRISNYERFNNYLCHKLPETLVTKRIYDGSADFLEIINRHFPNDNLETDVAIACGILLQYLEYTQKSELSHINRLTSFTFNDALTIDSSSLRNLEITRNMRDGTKKDSLLDVLDCTCTAMGARLLRRWLESPLLDPVKIVHRQDAIAALLNAPLLLQNCREILKSVQDLERILTRIDLGSANARDLVALQLSLDAIPELKKLLSDSPAKILSHYGQYSKTYTDLSALLKNAIVEQPPLSVREGGFIQDGYDIELDELRAIARDVKTFLQEMESRERDTTGIKSLKIGFNRVFGYYIEISNANATAAPVHYTRKQTLANAERYITPELKEFENKILGAQERITAIEFHLFNQLCENIREILTELQESARNLAEIDALYSFAEVASKNNYTRPHITTGSEIKIRDGRHPVIERLCLTSRYVSNDILIDNRDNEIVIITGPNMAGKSTYMRQTALLVLMAHTGSFIPAAAATIGIVDKIFTRIGASDDLSTGQSTFMVEMNEVAHIVINATKSSLIILDEIGRGTSTYDGMSIARAVLEYIKENIHAKTMFATHYHELTNLEEHYQGIKNCSVAVKERGNDITFLHRIIPGRADKSYGIHVASLAGLPKKILQNARKHLENLENNAASSNTERVDSQNAALQPEFDCNSLFDSRESETLSKLSQIDVMSVTPIEAINILFEMVNSAKKETGN